MAPPWWAPWLAAAALRAARGGSPGRGAEGGAGGFEDGAALLQASVEVGPAQELASAGSRGLRLLGEGSLCSLAAAGSLAREARAFFEEVAQPEPLAHRLSRAWVEACAGPGATDAGLVSQLRMVVHDFAVSGAGVQVEEAPSKVGEEEEEEEINCTQLLSNFQELGLKNSTRMLDYGCGPGEMLSNYAKCGLGSDHVGIDVQDVRSADSKNAFKFLELQRPYPASLEEQLASERLLGTFGFVASDRVFHHIGNEQDIRAIVRQLGKALEPCGKLLIVDWDNPGHPDLAPLFDLTHTFWSTLCLPYTREKAEKCVGEVSDEDLHKMWEGENTIYLSKQRYQQIIEEEAGVTLQHGRRQDSQAEDAERLNHTAPGGWYEVLHPFVHVYQKAC